VAFDRDARAAGGKTAFGADGAHEGGEASPVGGALDEADRDGPVEPASASLDRTEADGAGQEDVEEEDAAGDERVMDAAEERSEGREVEAAVEAVSEDLAERDDRDRARKTSGEEGRAAKTHAGVTGEAPASEGEHPRREVDGEHLVARVGEELGGDAGSATEVDDGAGAQAPPTKSSERGSRASTSEAAVARVVDVREVGAVHEAPGYRHDSGTRKECVIGTLPPGATKSRRMTPRTGASFER
jgi:hypothetical protein